MMNSPGISSHGDSASTWVFCASASSTPQLMAGACSPRPMKLNALSPRIMAGMDSVSDAMMWLRKPGSRCLKMIRLRLAPLRRAAAT